MPYQSVKKFNQNSAGSKKGWCLQNVRKGYGILPLFPNAITAWKFTEQHKDTNIPQGVDVPLYYTYAKEGHVNVRLANGKVWSDGNTYSSLADYLKKHPAVSYLGWGESVNKQRVIKYVKPQFVLPKVGAKIRLLPKDTRTTFKNGTTVVAGHIRVKDNTYVYTVRGYDKKFGNRILVNSKSAGGNGVSLALYYTNGARIAGWKEV